MEMLTVLAAMVRVQELSWVAMFDYPFDGKHILMVIVFHRYHALLLHPPHLHLHTAPHHHHQILLRLFPAHCLNHHQQVKYRVLDGRPKKWQISINP